MVGIYIYIYIYVICWSSGVLQLLCLCLGAELHNSIHQMMASAQWATSPPLHQLIKTAWSYAVNGIIIVKERERKGDRRARKKGVGRTKLEKEKEEEGRKESVWIIILYMLEWTRDREQGAIWRVVEEKMRGEAYGGEERAGGRAGDEWKENRDERRSSMKEYIRCAVPLRGWWNVN